MITRHLNRSIQFCRFPTGCLRLRSHWHWRWQVWGLVLLLAIALWSWPLAVYASPIRTLEEAPGQVVYQSRVAVMDMAGHRWQVVAFKRHTPRGPQPLALRLVGFPGEVVFVRGEPLVIEDGLGDRWSAPDDSAHVFTNADAPEPHIGQYRLQGLWVDLPDAIPLTLQVPTVAGIVPLSVSPGTVVDWKTLARSAPNPDPQLSHLKDEG